MFVLFSNLSKCLFCVSVSGTVLDLVAHRLPIYSLDIFVSACRVLLLEILQVSMPLTRHISYLFSVYCGLI